MGAVPPKLDGDMIAAHVANLSREPFRDLLTRLLECEPDPEKVKAYAEKYPDKWGQLVTMVARLGGYNERLEVANSHVVALAQLSDSELMARLQEKLPNLGIDPEAFKLRLAEKQGVPELSREGNGSKM